MNKKKETRYVIGKSAYEKHIDDKVHLYEMLHQIAFLAPKVFGEDEVETLIATIQKYGKAADDMFATWEIPGRYLVFGEKKDLAELKDKELEKLSVVLATHDTESMEQALKGLSWEQNYIIQGGSFRMLVDSIFELLALYGSLVRRVMALKNDKDVTRLQKQLDHSDGKIKRLYRRWGVPEDQNVTAFHVLNRYVRQKHLIPFEVVAMEESQKVDDLYE